MREVVKRWYSIERMNDYSQEWIWDFDTKEEAIRDARNIWEHQTDKEKQAKTMYVVQFDSVKENGEWTPITEDDEEYQEGMSYPGAYDVAFAIDTDGEHEYTTF